MHPLNRLAKELLAIHNGKCFVPEGNRLVEPFREMEKAGEVTMVKDPLGFTIKAQITQTP